MSGIGFLAYGSLIGDPGREIGPRIKRRVPTTTPFPVEYARFSKLRGGAPTVVPHAIGQPVRAEVLVLDDSVSLSEAKSLLWRRETHNEGSGRRYRQSTHRNAVRVEDRPGFCDIEHVLYTDFNEGGKIANPDPRELAAAAVASVAKAAPGKDGISYLIGLIDAGVKTALTPRYEQEILALTRSSKLRDALDSIKARNEI